jgi:hypothetical protein
MDCENKYCNFEEKRSNLWIVKLNIATLKKSVQIYTSPLKTTYTLGNIIFQN